jgi:hypothetical protein
MDNLRLSVDMPTELEYSLGNMTTATMLPAGYFPNCFTGSFIGSLIWWCRSEEGVAAGFTQPHAKADSNRGKQLIIKAPENPAQKLKYLSKVFPWCQVYSHLPQPYRVYFSTERLYTITYITVGGVTQHWPKGSGEWSCAKSLTRDMFLK